MGKIPMHPPQALFTIGARYFRAMRWFTLFAQQSLGYYACCGQTEASDYSFHNRLWLSSPGLFIFKQCTKAYYYLALKLQLLKTGLVTTNQIMQRVSGGLRPCSKYTNNHCCIVNSDLLTFKNMKCIEFKIVRI